LLHTEENKFLSMADSSKILKRPKNVINQCRVNTFRKYMEKNSGHYIQAGVVTLFCY
jgi:hypothetical protein